MADEKGEAGGRDSAFLRAWNRVVFLSTLATLVPWIVALIVSSTAESPESTAQRVLFCVLAGLDLALAAFFSVYFALYVWFGRLFSRGYRLALVVDVVTSQIVAFSFGAMAFWVAEGQPYGVATSFYLLDNFLSPNIWLAAIDWFASTSAVYMHASDGLFVPIHWATRLYATLVAFVEYYVILFVLTESVAELYSRVSRRERELDEEAAASSDIEAGRATPHRPRRTALASTALSAAEMTMGGSPAPAPIPSSHPLVAEAVQRYQQRASLGGLPPPPLVAAAANNVNCVVRMAGSKKNG